MRKKYAYLFVLVLSLVSFTANAQYCIPTFTYDCGSGSGDDIEGVFIDYEGSSVLDHDGTSCSTDGYGDFTSDSSLEVELEAGEEYDITITTNYSSASEYQKVWIDFDGDEEFDDDDELLFTASSGASSSSPTEGTITIPDDIAGIITTRLRVINRYSSAPEDACEPGGSWGETHDYTVIIVGENEDCFSPENLALDDISGGDADISWDEAPDQTSGYNWVLMLGDGDADPDVDTPEQDGNTSDTEITLTGLEDNTYYTFYVQADCDPDGESVWREVSFHEEGEGSVCEEAIAIGSTFPYTDSGDTADYLNEYSGNPGDDCGADGDDYLSGYEVVYSYTADDDYIITAELSGLSNPGSGIFVYESCDDIGDTCWAEGSVSETTDDHDFQFTVENGDEIYIVVSSNSMANTTEYTLDVSAVTCADYPEPDGDSDQDFVDGQTLEDLVVSGPNLTWYEDASGTTEITEPGDEELEDNETYYVTQTFQGCEGAILAITTTELSCTGTLEVTDSSGASVCGEGIVRLGAEGAEGVTGTEIYWYDAATDGNFVGSGNNIDVEVEETTSFWATEVALSGGTVAEQAHVEPEGTLSTTTNGGLIFEATSSFSIIDVEVFSTSSAGGDLVVSLKDIDDNNAIIATTTVTVPGGGTTTAPIPVTVPLNFLVPSGNYRLVKDSGPTFRYQSAANSNFPYELGEGGLLGEITGGATATGTSTLYYTFFNWTVSEAEVLCESDREEVVATVNDVADEEYAGTLPYTHTASTSDYGNNYAGSPGNQCSTSDNYLNGNDAVYRYTPDADMVVGVMLSDLSGDDASVFIYESCDEIGDSCLSGIVNTESSDDFGIEEFIVYEDTDYYIVVSGNGTPSSIDYTLTIDEAAIDCADYTEAPEGGPDVYFEAGDTLADLDVVGGNLTWYDSDGTTVLPGTATPVDGDTYFVTQTFDGCESDQLEVVAVEFDCSEMEIIDTTDNTIVCGGKTILTAEGSGNGSEIYWYDAVTDGEIVGVGEEFETPDLESTTSYWASEIFAEGGGSGFLPGQGMQTWEYGTGSTLTNRGVVFEAEESFTLVDVEVFSTGSGGDIDIVLYNDAENVVESTTVTIPGGGSTASPIPHTITLNFEIPSAGEYRLIRTSGSVSMMYEYNTPTYPYPIGDIGEMTGGATSTTATPNTSYMYIFYNWTVSTGEVICESPREEAVATVSTDGDEVISALPYSDTNNSADYNSPFSGAPGADCGSSENYLNGNNVVYQFTADEDDVVDISLSDLSGFYAGVFVYESCSDIEESCVAGAVAGASDEDFAIEDFYLTGGQEYYIVVTSWLSPTIEYTLDIIPFDCDEFEMPEAESPQDFVDGDTVDDLEVEGTADDVEFTWYEDDGGAPGSEITDPAAEDLVDGTTYWVTQTLTYIDCESEAVAVEVNEIDCSGLEIIDTTDDTVVCRGEMTLEAEAGGEGSEIYWYDAETGGEMVGVGSTFETPELTNTTSYWASEVLILGEAPLVGQAKTEPTLTTTTTLGGYGLVFDVDTPFTLVSVEVYPTTGGTMDLELRDSDNVVLQTVSGINVPSDNGSTAHTITLNLNIPAGDGLRLIKSSTGSPTMIRESSGNTYPYAIGTVAEITGGVLNGGSPLAAYYWFYNWTISTGEAVCESDRVEAVAEVTADGDVEIDELPYNTQDDTSIYGNSFSGAPGSSCATSDNYLAGDDVVYLYTPGEDNIINIELSDLSSDATGVFVYGSCGEIGDECIAGAIVEEEGTGTLIEELYLTGGEDYFIVISSSDGDSVSYTLDVTGFECDEVETPIGEEEQYYVAGSTIEDLTIETNQFNEETIWYEDEAGTTPISETEELEDGETYYVSQTILGCESGLLEITAFELDCNDLEILSTTDGIACVTGPVLLEAEASGVGSAIYWYDAETDGNVVGVGEEFETSAITATTSYWAEEVFIQGEEAAPGQAHVVPVGTLSTTTNGGLIFEATTSFTIQDVEVFSTSAAGGDLEVSLKDIDDDNAVVATTTVTVPGGGTTTAPIPVTVPLNFLVPPGNYRLVKDSGPTFRYQSALNSDFPYELGNGLGEITGGATATGTSTLYYLFFNWTITQGEVQCESPRVEAIAEINDEETLMPTGDTEQSLCEGATLSDIDVSGDAIIWYPQEDGGEAFEEDVTLQNGQTYYASQTLGACESIERLAVLVTVIEASELPEGDFNQTYSEGETIADLEVEGENLIWYTDEEGTEIIENPEEVELNDQDTYYVSQTTGDNCQSELLPITVHQELNTSHPAFDALTYYPNPMKERLTISNTSRIEAVTLYNLLGQKVMSKQLNIQETTVDVSGLASGTYLLEVTIEGTKGIFKLIKE